MSRALEWLVWEEWMKGPITPEEPWKACLELSRRHNSDPIVMWEKILLWDVTNSLLDKNHSNVWGANLSLQEIQKNMKLGRNSLNTWKPCNSSQSSDLNPTLWLTSTVELVWTTWRRSAQNNGPEAKLVQTLPNHFYKILKCVDWVIQNMCGKGGSIFLRQGDVPAPHMYLSIHHKTLRLASSEQFTDKGFLE